MMKHRRQASKFGALLAILAIGGVLGGAMSATARPALAHDCQENECDSFLIFWERCEANIGNDTFCGNPPPGERGCTTGSCGHG